MKMRILLLTDINSAHTQKWATALVSKGCEVGIFSFSIPNANWYTQIGVKCLSNETHTNQTKLNKRLLTKLGYLGNLPKLKSIIIEFEPDVLHAHYASSYGFLGALSGFHPYVISAWGSDVMHFPKISFIHKSILVYNLKHSDFILATSKAIENSIKNYINRLITIIPFGIDLTVFRPLEITSLFSDEKIVIGVVKSLETIYGIDILIKAFKMLVEKMPNAPLVLLIVGGGSKEEEYKALVKEMNVEEQVKFIGKVKYEDVVKYHNMIDVFVNVSRNESFGVSVLEASACSKPVIVSKVGGLTEVVKDSVTGILVESENVSATALAMERLVIDESLRLQMGKAGKAFVEANYDFTKNVDDTMKVYRQLISTRK